MNNTENSMMHFRLDYSPPLFAFEGVELDFELNPLKTIVSSKIQLKRLLPGSLTLKGEDLELISIKVDGGPFKEFEHSSKELTLHHLPDQCLLEIVNSICPEQNTSLMGLYVSEGNFFTQCEAKNMS